MTEKPWEECEDARDSATVKVCAGCPEKGPQPLQNFNRNKRNGDGLQTYCRECQNRMDRERRARRKDETEQKGDVPAPAKETDALTLLLTVDLTQYPDVYDKIKREAEEEDRTPELQVRNWLRNHPLIKGAA